MSEKIGKLIASRLKLKGKGQAWLAEQAGVSVNAVSKWTKSGKIARERVARVAELLGLSADELVSGQVKAQEAPPAAAQLPDSLRLTIETAEELRVITAYRIADKLGRLTIDSAADAVLDRMHSNIRHK